MKLENRLKVWRAKRGITQDELAKAVGMSRQSINAIEKGRFVPSILTALKMSHYFETTIEELFYLKEN
ncbi:helix-turn-helix transcriptional regulator [candidate division WOR-3 bacterium]|nr:helix-turn-helix transcriptional regulator [candidate division WOR-3 bacterium]